MNETTAITHEARLTIKNISNVAIMKVAQYPFLALSMLLVPRLMQPEVYGQYALLISIFTVTASLIDFGAGTELFGRFVPEFLVNQQPGLVRKLASNILGLRALIGAVAVFVLLPGLVALYGEQFPIAILVLICAIVLVRQVEGVPYSLLFGLNRLGLQSSQLPMRRALSLVLLLVCYHFFGLTGAIASTLVVDLILSALAFTWTAGHFRLADLKFDLGFLKPYLRFDMVFYAAWVLLNIWQRSGNLLIERLTGSTAEVAQFDIPNQAYLVTVSLTFVAIDSLIPIFSNLLMTGREQKLREWSTVAIKHTVVLATLLFWAFIFLGPSAIPLVLGPAYNATYLSGAFLLGSLFPMAMTQIGFVFAVSYRKPSRYLLALVASYAVFLGTSILLVPAYGAAGCAMATLASALTSAAILFLFFRSQLSAGLLRCALPLVLWVLFVPFALLRESLWRDLALLAVAGAVYVAVLFALKVLRWDEINTFIRAIRHKPAAI